MFNKPFRLHFSSVIENTLSVCWVIILILITSIIGETENIETKQSLVLIVGLLAVTFVVLVVNFIWWRKTYIILDNDTLIIERKLLMSNKTTIGIKNIAAVNLEQNILQKIFGTYKIKLDTNSLTTANETDVKIVLKKDKAIEFQKRIIELINTETPVQEEQDKYDIQYDFESVMLHSMLSIPTPAIIYGVFAIITLGIIFHNPEARVDVIGSGIQGILSILLIIVPAVYTMIKAIFRLYNFKVKRNEDKIYIKYGLLTTKTYTVPLDKINAVVVKQPLLARIFRKYTVELINVGMGELQEETPVLLLMGTKKEIIQKMARILPEVNIEEETIPQPKKAIVPISIKLLIWGLVLIVPVIMFVPVSYVVLAIIAIIVIIFVALGILMYKTSRIGIYDKYVKIVNGIFEKNAIIIEYKKLQYLALNQSVITEKLKIAKSSAYILAEMSKICHDTGYFETSDLDKIVNKVV